MGASVLEMVEAPQPQRSACILAAFGILPAPRICEAGLAPPHLMR